ncbi:Protein HPO-15, partial [Aphelenchoides avenae]
PPHPETVSVAIVGAGFAGLSAYRRLSLAGFKNVHIYEASDRPGGRVYPVAFEDGYLQHGAEFINGEENPIFEVARRLGLVTGELVDDTLWDTAAYHSGKCSITAEQIEAFEKFSADLETQYHQLATSSDLWQKTVGELFNASYQAFIETRKPSSSERKVFNALSRFYRSYYEGEWSAPIDKLALMNYAKWDDKSDKFAAFTLNKFGYERILAELMKTVNVSDIHYNSRVTNINYGGGPKTTLTLSNGEVSLAYDYVIVTVPLGYLKRHAHDMFTPALPARKLRTIEAMGFGSLLKVFLVYEKPFWDGNVTSLAPIPISGCSQPRKLSNYLHTFEPLSWNPNVLVGWLSGNGPAAIDSMSDKELASQITEHFRDLIVSIDIPEPRQIIRTSWLSNPNFYGAYSFITPEASALSDDPLHLLSRPVYHRKRPRVLFAGEATHSRIYQTTIGAYLSGSREAHRIMNYVKAAQRQSA